MSWCCASVERGNWEAYISAQINKSKEKASNEGVDYSKKKRKVAVRECSGTADSFLIHCLALLLLLIFQTCMTHTGKEKRKPS
jgi:hypothetical protein